MQVSSEILNPLGVLELQLVYSYSLLHLFFNENEELNHNLAHLQTITKGQSV